MLFSFGQENIRENQNQVLNKVYLQPSPKQMSNYIKIRRDLLILNGLLMTTHWVKG